MSKRAKTEDHGMPKETPRAHKEPFYYSQRFWSIALAALFLLTAIFTAVNLRLATTDLEIADRWAASSIDQQGTSMFAAQIRQQYPTLPDASVQEQAQKRWAQYRIENEAVVEAQQAQLAEQLRAFFQFEAGSERPYNQTYVLEMDPYLYWHHAENYADHGYICDEGSEVLGDGACIDDKRLAPTGAYVRVNLHSWLEAQAITIMRALNSNLHTLTIVFFIPVILAALAVIPAFFIGRKFGGNLGGFIAAMMIAVHPVLMNRTIAGFADTDGYNYLLPLLVIWLLLEAFEARHWWSRITLASLAGLCVGLFAFAWAGWWLVFLVPLACFIVIVLFTLVKRARQHRLNEAYRATLVPLVLLGAFTLSTALFVTLFQSFRTFLRSFIEPFTLASNLQSAVAGADLTGWPNILTTVAELNIPSLATIINNLGGTFVVVLAAFGLLVSLFDPRTVDLKVGGIAAAAFLYYFVLITKGLGLPAIGFLILFALPLAAAVLYLLLSKEEANIALPLFLMGWLIAVLFATTKGIRFLLLGIPPFAIGFAIGIGWLFIAVTHAMLDGSRSPKRMLATYGIAGALVLLVIFNPVAGYSPLKAGQAAADGQIPGMNDAWWEALTVIREQTPPDTIITSWWDFGHWFRNIGNRSVTFDGASQNSEPGHIVGKILLTNDEREALGLLRMMDCGHNNGYQIVRKDLDVVPARELIGELVLLDRAAAQERLAQTNLSVESQQQVLENTHCDPPPAVFITSGDMIGKAGVWGHFGSWDFRRAMVYHSVRSLPQAEALEAIQRLNYTAAQANEMYFTLRSFRSEGEANSWISGWPSYVTQSWSGCQAANGTVNCQVMAGVAQTQQGLLVIETIQFDATSPHDATMTYGVYSNGQRLGGSAGKPAKVSLADYAEDAIESRSFADAEFAIGVLVRKQENQYAVLLADPLQVDSLFTQLYYLDGQFTPHFTKLVETQEMGGSKIIVWNVTWPER